MPDRPDKGMPLGRGPESEPKTIDELAEEQKQQETQEVSERFRVPETTKEEQEARQGMAREGVEEASREQEVSKEREQVESTPQEGEQPGKGAKPAISQLPEDLQDDVFLKAFMASDKPKQIKTLVVITLKKGVRHAIQLAQSSKDPYLMDIFHDTLVDELHDQLVNNKKLKDQ
ncbi:MAG: hypothetical protein KC653_01025 [Candidatus Andersenbacteria bacterium]|nr:hypothetical protein [Candidatus Andersenbacteria bacterium]